MFKYVGDISEISHYIIEKFLENKKIAVDGTLGNGYDTDFLKEHFEFVYAFDIQKEPCDAYSKHNYENVKVINDSHHKFNEYNIKNIDCIMYNLGFLPKADKDITTNHTTSLESIKKGLEVLNEGGIMTICIYIGHDEGKKEESCIIPYLESLDKKRYGVMLHKFLNRSKVAPMLVVVEKKNLNS